MTCYVPALYPSPEYGLYLYLLVVEVVLAALLLERLLVFLKELLYALPCIGLGEGLADVV